MSDNSIISQALEDARLKRLKQWMTTDSDLSRLQSLIQLHIKPYNLGDQGEIESFINKLIQDYKLLTQAYKELNENCNVLKKEKEEFQIYLLEANNHCLMLQNILLENGLSWL